MRLQRKDDITITHPHPPSGGIGISWIYKNRFISLATKMSTFSTDLCIFTSQTSPPLHSGWVASGSAFLDFASGYKTRYEREERKKRLCVSDANSPEAIVHSNDVLPLLCITSKIGGEGEKRIHHGKEGEIEERETSQRPLFPYCIAEWSKWGHPRNTTLLCYYQWRKPPHTNINFF